MDPTNADFQVRCESNPALYTRCTTIWMGSWRKESMREVAASKLAELLSEIPDASELVEHMVTIHDSSVSSGATPRDFINFLQSYEHLYRSKVGGVEGDMNHLSAGLSKLQEAADMVDELTRNAVHQRAQLKEKQTAADDAMNHITEALQLASDRRKEVQELTQKLNEAEKQTLGRKDAIEEELSSITPILEQAKQAVGSIKSDNLNEIRSLKMPPEPIHDVLSAVLMLLGINDTSWLSMKKFLGARGVKDKILSYNAREMPAKIRRDVSKVVKAKASSFEHATIKHVSAAAAPLAAWCKANIKYAEVLEKIEPLESDLAVAQKSLDEMQEGLRSNQAELATIDEKVAHLKKEFAKLTSDAERLRTALETTEVTLNRAQNLLGKLSGEKSRWERTVGELKRSVATLPMQMLLAAGFVTYLAQSSEDVRRDALLGWQRMVGLDSFDVLQLLSSESEMLVWKAKGLPADTLSMQNAVVILNSTSRAPFIIDPATQATKWLQQHLQEDKSSPVEVLTASDPRFQTQVELAVRFGKTLVILEVDRVEPLLYPLVRKDLYVQGPRLVVQIGEKTVDYNERFKLFLVTRNPSPHMPPDAQPLVSVVNFTVTRSGLEGQLLGVTLQHEQPELEQQKSRLLRQEEELKVQLSAVEKALVEELANSTGNILENQSLIDSLTQTKQKSADIEASLRGSAEASVELDRQREVYRPFAHAGSKLYFILADLRASNHMYQFSLSSFTHLFKDTLTLKFDTEDVNERINRLSTAIGQRAI